MIDGQEKAECIDQVIDALSKCFGSGDGYFAVHPLDEKRAKEALSRSRICGLTEEEFRQLARGKVPVAHMGRDKVLGQIDTFLDENK